jgi:aspartate kinase
LLEISRLLSRKKDTDAGNAISKLKEKYLEVIEELFSTEEFKNKAKAKVGRIFEYINTFTEKEFSISNGKIIAAQGEMLSSNLVVLYLRELGGANIVLLPALEFMKLNENGTPDEGYIANHLTDLLRKNAGGEIYVTQGFICRNFCGEVDNLGRNASDYTATLSGAALQADEIQIWTDIDGVHDGDPRILLNTHCIPHLSYEEAGRMAYFGAKVLHTSCILPAKMKNIPVFLRNTMEPERNGTMICNKKEKGLLKAVTCKDNISLISVESDRTLPSHSFFRYIFEVFDNNRITVDLIQVAEVSVLIAIDNNILTNNDKLNDVIDELRNYGKVNVETGLACVSVIGDIDNNNLSEVQKKVLGHINDVTVKMITGGDFSVSLVVDSEDKKRVLESLHQSLFCYPLRKSKYNTII